MMLETDCRAAYCCVIVLPVVSAAVEGNLAAARVPLLMLLASVVSVASESVPPENVSPLPTVAPAALPALL